MHVCWVTPVMSNSFQLYGPYPTRLLCPWDSPGKNTAVSCHALLQGIFLIQGSNLGLLHCRQILYCWVSRETPINIYTSWLIKSRLLIWSIEKIRMILILNILPQTTKCESESVSCSVVSNSFAIPWTITCQAPLPMGFSRQEYWCGLPSLPPGDFPDPGIKLTSPESQAEFFTVWATREAHLLPSTKLNIYSF